MKIELRKIQKSYGSQPVLQRVSLTIETNERFFLLGPSGCGKTTLLRILAGLMEPDSGDIFIQGKCVNGLPPESRKTPMVFQSYALWPHLTVFENVAYGLRLQNLSESEIRKRTLDALAATRMKELETRSSNQLSGGQQQRVAIARALAVDSPVLLFDEPLSNLDAKLRLEMRQEILDIHQARPFTAVYVTHDQEEAMTMATRIALLDKGQIQQLGTPHELYTEPANRFVAEFMGPINWIPAERGLSGFRPSAGRLGDKSVTGGFQFQGEILSVQYLGASQKLVVRSTSPKLENDFQIIELNPKQPRKSGDRVDVCVAPEDLIKIPDAK